MPALHFPFIFSKYFVAQKSRIYEFICVRYFFIVELVTKIWSNISKMHCILNLLFAFHQRISSIFFFVFRRGRKTGSHARRRSAKFHGCYVEQLYTDTHGTPDYSRCKTVLPESHLPHNVTIAHRCFCETESTAECEQTEEIQTSNFSSKKEHSVVSMWYWVSMYNS